VKKLLSLRSASPAGLHENGKEFPSVRLKAIHHLKLDDISRSEGNTTLAMPQSLKQLLGGEHCRVIFDHRDMWIECVKLTSSGAQEMRQEIPSCIQNKLQTRSSSLKRIAIEKCRWAWAQLAAPRFGYTPAVAVGAPTNTVSQFIKEMCPDNQQRIRVTPAPCLTLEALTILRERTQRKANEALCLLETHSNHSVLGVLTERTFWSRRIESGGRSLTQTLASKLNMPPSEVALNQKCPLFCNQHRQHVWEWHRGFVEAVRESLIFYKTINHETSLGQMYLLAGPVPAQELLSAWERHGQRMSCPGTQLTVSQLGLSVKTPSSDSVDESHDIVMLVLAALQEWGGRFPADFSAVGQSVPPQPTTSWGVHFNEERALAVCLELAS